MNTKVSIEIQTGEENYVETSCPFCGFVENLDASIFGNWECPECGSEYYIVFVRAVLEPNEAIASGLSKWEIDKLTP